MAYNSSNLSSKMPVTGPKSSCEVAQTAKWLQARSCKLGATSPSGQLRHSSGGLWLLNATPTWLTDDCAVNEHRATTDNCSDHLPGELTAEVRADPAAGLKILRAKRPPLFGIHDRQIRIGTNCESSLAWVQPEELRRGRRGEMGHAFERQAARVHALGHAHR